MSAIIKVFLLLAAVVCISKAQLNEPGQNCLCQRTRNSVVSRADIKDIQIYPATIFCDRVEIVVTSGQGFRYCLNPELQSVKKILARIIKTKKTSISRSTTTSLTTDKSLTTSV